MAGAHLVLRPAGNSSKIEEIADTELRNNVHQLYQHFWAVWNGKTSPIEITLMGIVLLPILLFVFWGMFSGWLFALVATILLALSIWGMIAMVRGYHESVQQGKEDFAKLMSELPRATEALRSLRYIEPWRMWLLKRTLPVSP